MAGSDVRQNEQAVGGITPAPPVQDPCTPLRLAAAAAWQVMRARQVRDFPRVLGLLEAVGQAAPDVVFFRHYARLRLGLQAAVIMGMLQEEQPDGKIYDAVDTYFPEGEHQRHPLATARDLRLVGEAQETFRELVLGLLSDRQRRETYVEEQLAAEYGEPFLDGLEGLLYEYLERLESTLPPPQLQQLQETAWSECPLAGPPQHTPELSVLAQYLTDMGHHQHGGSPTLPLVTSTPSLPQPVPGTLGSRRRQSQEGAVPAQEEHDRGHRVGVRRGGELQPPQEGQLPAHAAQHPDPHLRRPPGPPRRVPWLLRSRDPAPAPQHRHASLRKVPHKSFIGDTK
ncbi:TERF1-interacting nuclear factor 2 isoform X2 [Gopherus flavomarginatus]|uniref:TERF1-interacting nuclear factor 2 isoform X2 n=1 Tax=Gopherus flavomarginatus TaxID=286002 RepID=UPI0021CBD3B7|nr:TERF1-interacting nuclear factor 2 isoform X2 [Gopherus flavomarginatus]